jgi:amino acid transporter
MKKKETQILGLLTFSFLYVLTYAPDVFAQFTIKQPDNTGVKVDSSKKGDVLLNDLLGNVIALIFTASAIGVLIFVLWGAFDWITSGGNKDKLQSAQKKISSALIGMVVLALSFFVIAVVGSIVGFNPLGPLPLPSLLQNVPGATVPKP